MYGLLQLVSRVDKRLRQSLSVNNGSVHVSKVISVGLLRLDKLLIELAATEVLHALAD